MPKVTIIGPLYVSVSKEIPNTILVGVMPAKPQPMQVNDDGIEREIRIENGKLFYKSNGNWYQVTANQLGINE